MTAQQAKHVAALANPAGCEVPLVFLYQGLIQYIECHELHYDTKLGNDPEMGATWLQMANCFVDLLNGETGRLDVEVLDGDIRKRARDAWLIMD